MESRAYFLKYRPQTISELSLVEVRENLKRIFQSEKIPQAFLFVGNKGSGKTSAARIIAKVVNCTNRQPGEFEPCNRCDSCLSIVDGTAMDLIEIDAASNRGIDDIRSLKEKVRLTPVKLKFKVYIIDEVHMLTTEAFNALLKTLEEPPPHSVFILCTTNPEKVPATIISRCLRFNFRKASQKEMVENLKNVVKKEKLKIEDGVVEEITRSAEGSFRDGQKILEQLSTGRKEITLEAAKEFLGKNEAQSPRRLIGFMAEKQLEKALGEIQRLSDHSIDFQIFLELLLEDLRRVLLIKLGAEDSDGDTLSAEVPKFDLEDLKNLIKLLLPVGAQMKLSPITQLPLEMVIIDWIGQDVSDSEPKEVQATQPVAEIVKLPDVPKKTESVTKSISENSEISVDLDIGQYRQIDDQTWKKILTVVKPLNHSIEALLRATRPLKLNGNTLTLEVFYKFHKDQLEQNKRRQIVEAACKGVIGTDIKLQCILGQKAKEALKEAGEGEKSAENNDIIGLAESIFNNETH